MMIPLFLCSQVQLRNNLISKKTEKGWKSKSHILSLTLMLLVANSTNTKMMQKNWKMFETLAHGYSSESIQQELSNEYQYDRV